MKKRRIILTLTILLVVVAVAWWTLTPHEPVYEGRRLSEWLADLNDQKPVPAHDAAVEAVRHIGTNGLPVIIRMLSPKDSMLRETFEKLAGKQSFIKFDFVPAPERRRRAVLACSILGSDAKPAIPALVELLNSGFTQGYVGVALGQIGPEAIEPLLSALTNQNNMVRHEVVVTLGYMAVVPADKTKLDMPSAISALITSLSDTSPNVRRFAARSLGQIGAVESLVVPALIERLQEDSDVSTLWNACLALGEFGDRATSAVPFLVEALQDYSGDVRGTAAIALVQIEPENQERIESIMPLLIENLEGIGGKNLNFRYTTLQIIGRCGEQARPAVPALLAIAASGDDYERRAAIAALKQIDPEAASEAGKR